MVPFLYWMDGECETASVSLILTLDVNHKGTRVASTTSRHASGFQGYYTSVLLEYRSQSASVTSGCSPSFFFVPHRFMKS